MHMFFAWEKELSCGSQRSKPQWPSLQYMARCQVAKEAVWLTGLLEDFRLDLRPPLVILGDNQGALALTENPVFHPRLKHIAIQYHFTRELVQAG